MVEGENGEPLLTPKGIAVLKAEMQGDGIIPRDQ
jgi:hypothetical protein